MVDLPDRVRRARFAALNQVVCFGVNLGTLMGQGQKIGWQAANDSINHPVAGRFFSEMFGQSLDSAINR